MSEIRCIYREASPDFPATDQHPDAERYGPLHLPDGGVVFVDAVGGEPLLTDIEAILSPPSPVPETISDRQFFQQLAVEGTIANSEALAAVKIGAIPATLQVLLAAMPVGQQFGAEMLLSGATEFRRDHPLTLAIGAAQNRSPAQIDDFFRAASAL